MVSELQVDLPSSEALWHERFAATLEATVDAVVIIDQVGAIETVNSAVEKIFGYRVSELIGRNVSILMPAGYARDHDRFLSRYLETGNAKIIGIGREVVGRRRDGSEFPMDLSVGEGRLGGRRFFVGLVRDITERKALEEQLRQREEELRWAHDNALVATATLDLEGRFRTVNHACSRLYGGDAAELLGRRFVELCHADDRSEVESLLGSLTSGERPAFQVRHRCVRRDGEVRYGSLHASTIHDQQARPIRLVIQMVDRTEQIAAERAALEIQERLAHVDRLSLLGEMTAGIAHEVNQPLGAIANYSQALLSFIDQGRFDPARHREVVEKIAGQALRAGEIIRRLRALARRREHGRASVDLNHVICEVLRLAEIEARLQSVRIELDLDPGLPAVSIDEIQIQQVVLNLLRNAMEAMVNAGVEGDRIEVRSQRRGENIRVSVADHGPGIAAEILDQILDPFFTSKTSGMGLGLSICQSIVSAHGGELGFENRDGEGATFYFDLPVDHDDGNDEQAPTSAGG